MKDEIMLARKVSILIVAVIIQAYLLGNIIQASYAGNEKVVAVFIGASCLLLAAALYVYKKIFY